MKGRQAGLLLIGVMLGVLVASVTWGLLGAHNAQAQHAKYFVDIVTLEGQTGDNGSFAIGHGVREAEILGMTVAIHGGLGTWHVMDTSDGTENKFYWTNVYAMGRISQPQFANQPVRVVLFVGYPQG